MAKQTRGKRTRERPAGGRRSRQPTIPQWLPVQDSPSWSDVVDATRLFAKLWRGVWGKNEQLWGNPGLRAALDIGLKQFVERLNSWKGDLERLDPHALSTTDLLVAFQHSYWGETAIRNLVPIPYSPDPRVRLAAGYETLIAYGVMSRATGQGVDPLHWAVTIGSAQIPGVVLWNEVLRRGEGHQAGFAAAIIRLCHELSRLGTQAGHWVEQAARSFGKKRFTGESRFTQALFTVEKEWGHLDPFEMLTMALCGTLDVARSAVQRDDIDDWRKQNRRREITFQFDEQDESQADASQVARLSTEAFDRHEKQADHDSEVRLAIRNLCREHQALKLDAYIHARMDGANQKEAAAAADITSRTARKYDRLLEKCLGPIVLSSWSPSRKS